MFEKSAYANLLLVGAFSSGIKSMVVKTGWLALSESVVHFELIKRDSTEAFLLLQQNFEISRCPSLIENCFVIDLPIYVADSRHSLNKVAQLVFYPVTNTVKEGRGHDSALNLLHDDVDISIYFHQNSCLETPDLV